MLAEYFIEQFQDQAGDAACAPCRLRMLWPMLQAWTGPAMCQLRNVIERVLVSGRQHRPHPGPGTKSRGRGDWEMIREWRSL